MRGGRKGGLPVCEPSVFVSKAGRKSATSDVKIMAEDVVPENGKHLSAHVAIEAQPSIALSRGFAFCGQQSMSSIPDMSAISVDFKGALTPPAAGSMATDKAIRSANTVRPTFMARAK
jgi:hypothetical protein